MVAVEIIFDFEYNMCGIILRLFLHSKNNQFAIENNLQIL